MKRLVLTLPCIALLAACSMDRQANGVTADGSAIKVEHVMSGMTDKFRLVSSEGWSCSGEAHYSRTSSSDERSFPLVCTDGTTGTAKVSYPSKLRGAHTNLPATIEFSLSNGKSGTVRT